MRVSIRVLNALPQGLKEDLRKTKLTLFLQVSMGPVIEKLIDISGVS